MARHSHLFKSFPQFGVIHMVKGFGIVNKAEIDVFLELSCFFHDPADVDNLISGSSAILKTLRESLCVDHNKLWKILKEMGIPDHLNCFLRKLYAGQGATVRIEHGTTD